MTTRAAARAVKATGPRSSKGMQSRARLLESAEHAFEEMGYLDARITDIVEHAGLSYGAFYHYFDSKEELLREVAATVLERLGEPLYGVTEDRTSGLSLTAGLRTALERHFETCRRDGRILQVIAEVARYDDTVKALRFERYQQYLEQLASSIRQMQRYGMCDPLLDPTIASAALGGMAWRFTEMWLTEGFVDCDADQAVDQLARLFLNALGVTPTSAQTPRGAT